MNRTKRIFIWVWRAWHVIIMGPVIAAHWTLVWALPGSTAFIHKWTSAVAQGIGGPLVIYFLSKNLGLFGKGGLWAVFTAWFRAFPWSSKHYVLSAASANINLVGAAAGLVASGGTLTLEARIDALEQQLKAASQKLFEVEQALTGEIAQLRVETVKGLQEGQTALALLSDKLTETAVGSFTPQIFGVMLALYGVWLGAYIQP